MNNPNNTLAYKQYVLDEIAKLGGGQSYVMVATDPNNDGNIILEYRGEIPEGSVGGLTAEQVQAMIDAALANLPAAVELPSAEEVSF